MLKVGYVFSSFVFNCSKFTNPNGGMNLQFLPYFKHVSDIFFFAFCYYYWVEKWLHIFKSKQVGGMGKKHKMDRGAPTEGLKPENNIRKSYPLFSILQNTNICRYRFQKYNVLISLSLKCLPTKTQLWWGGLI